MAWASGVAIAAWMIGMGVLGRHWNGYERTPGVWADSVSLARWFVCWAGLALLGLISTTRVRGWPARLFTLIPLVAWILWQLRKNALGPIPMLVYVIPTGLVWCAALAAGQWVHQWLAPAITGTRPTKAATSGGAKKTTR